MLNVVIGMSKSTMTEDCRENRKIKKKQKIKMCLQLRWGSMRFRLLSDTVFCFCLSAVNMCTKTVNFRHFAVGCMALAICFRLLAEAFILFASDFIFITEDFRCFAMDFRCHCKEFPLAHG